MIHWQQLAKRAERRAAIGNRSGLLEKFSDDFGRWHRSELANQYETTSSPGMRLKCSELLVTIGMA